MSLESFQIFQQQLSAILETLLATAFRDITQLVKYSLLHDMVHSREGIHDLTGRLQGAGGQRRGESEYREDEDEKKEETLFIVKQDPEEASEKEKTEEEDGLHLEASLLRNCRGAAQLSTTVGVERVNAEDEMDKHDQLFHEESPLAQSSGTLTMSQSCQWTYGLLKGSYRSEAERTAHAIDLPQRGDVQAACTVSVSRNKKEDSGPLKTEEGGSRQGDALPFGMGIMDHTGKAQGLLEQTPPNDKARRTSERDSSELSNTSPRNVALTMRGMSSRLPSIPHTSNPTTTPCVTPVTGRGQSHSSSGFSSSPSSMLARESIQHKINRSYMGKGHSSMGHASEVIFSRKEQLSGPVIAGEVKKKLHECSHCGKTFLLKRNLLYHQRYHMAERTHTCTECGKGFVYRCHLNAHMRSHSGERAYNCTECGKSFIYLWNLKKHMTIHLGLRPYCCSTCNKSFIWKSDLKKHKQIHTKKTV